MSDSEDWWKHPENFADYILIGEGAQRRLEDDIECFIGREQFVEKMWFDTYDGSIELCFRADLEYDPEKLREFLASRGFTYGWLNFSDGTEQHFGGGKIFDRRSVAYPKWTEEMAKEVR